MAIVCSTNILILILWLFLLKLVESQLPIKSTDEENSRLAGINSYQPLTNDSFQPRPGCLFGNNIYSMGQIWTPDLGPPFGVMYCIKCQCTQKPPLSSSFGPYDKRQKIRTMIKCRNFKYQCPKLKCREEPIIVLGKCCKVCRPKMLWSTMLGGVSQAFDLTNHPYVGTSPTAHGVRGGDSAFFHQSPSAASSVQTSFKNPGNIWVGREVNKTREKSESIDSTKFHYADQIQSDESSLDDRRFNHEYVELYALMLYQNGRPEQYPHNGIDNTRMVANGGIVGRAYVIVERDYLYLTIKTVGIENPLVILVSEKRTSKVLQEIAVTKLTKNFDGEFYYTKICAYIAEYQNIIGSLEELMEGKVNLGLKFNQYGRTKEILGTISDHRFIKTESFASLLSWDQTRKSQTTPSYGGIMVITKGYYDHSTIDFLVKIKNTKTSFENDDRSLNLGDGLQKDIEVTSYDSDYIKYYQGRAMPGSFEDIIIKFVWHRKFALDIPFIPLKEITGYIDMRSGEFASSWTSVPKHAMRLISSGNVKIIVQIGQNIKMTGIVFPKSTCSAHYALLSGYDAYPMTHEGAAGFVGMKIEDNGQLSYKIKLVGVEQKVKAITIQPYSHRRRNVIKKRRNRVVAKFNYDANSSLSIGNIPFLPLTVIHLLIHKEFYINVETESSQTILSGPINLVNFGDDSFETFPIVVSGSSTGVKSPASALIWLKTTPKLIPISHLNSKSKSHYQETSYMSEAAKSDIIFKFDPITSCHITYKVQVAGFNYEQSSPIMEPANKYSYIRLVIRKLLYSETENLETRGVSDAETQLESVPNFSTNNNNKDHIDSRNKMSESNFLEITGLKRNIAVGTLMYPKSQMWCTELNNGNAFFQINTKAYPEGEIGAQLLVTEVRDESNLSDSSNILSTNSIYHENSSPITITPSTVILNETVRMSCKNGTQEHTNTWSYYIEDCRKCQCRDQRIYCSEIRNNCGPDVCSDIKVSKGFFNKCCSPNEIRDCEKFKVHEAGINNEADNHIKGCILGDITHAIDSRWHPHVPPFGIDKCVTCQCNDQLEVICKRLTCPLLTCPLNNAIYLDGACCKVCKSDIQAESGKQITKQNSGSRSIAGHNIQKDGPSINSPMTSCFYQNKEYMEGEKFHPKLQSFGRVRAIKCVCKRGKFKCQRQKCKKDCDKNMEDKKQKMGCCDVGKGIIVKSREKVRKCNKSNSNDCLKFEKKIKKRSKRKRKCSQSKILLQNIEQHNGTAVSQNPLLSDARGGHKGKNRCGRRGRKRRKNRKKSKKDRKRRKWKNKESI